MTRDDVRNAMHDYFDGFLSPEERDTIESYLEEYKDIAAEYELLNKLLNKAESMPLGIKTPNSIIDKISEELLSESLKKIEYDKQELLKKLTENTELEGAERKRIKNLKQKPLHIKSDDQSGSYSKKSLPKLPIILLVLVVIIVGGYFGITYLSSNLPWSIKSSYGVYKTGSTPNGKSIDKNEILSTFDSTKVTLMIPGAGQLSLGSYSNIKVIQGKEIENIIEFNSGKIDANCNTEGANLIINTPPAVINVIAGEFTAVINDQGNLKTITSNGALKIQDNAKEVVLVRDHICEAKAGLGIGIPYHVNADSTMIELLNNISFGQRNISDFDQIINIATPADGISLLYLLYEAKNPAERLPIFLKLNEFYPVVPGISQHGVLKLDKDMIDTWRDEIEWQL